jgi:hypothetical protein
MHVPVQPSVIITVSMQQLTLRRPALKLIPPFLPGYLQILPAPVQTTRQQHAVGQ